MTSVRIEQLTKSFGKTLAVDAVDLYIPDSQLITLLGPSGCGKSTTLRCIAGLTEPDRGSIYFGDRLINDVPTARRNIGLLFQRLALFPHMKVFDNVAFGLRMRGVSATEITRRVQEALHLVQLPGFEQRYPRQLSGGQQQRVALARTIVTDPDILLFDEPLSSLDAKLREELKTEIRRLHQQTGKTTIYVTHDQGEAFAISDKVYVMNNGRIEQEGTPRQLYVNPSSPFVASFIGANNFVQGQAIGPDPSQSGHWLIDALGARISAVSEGLSRPNEPVLLLIRPEDMTAALGPVTPGQSSTQANVITGRVAVSIFAGASTALEVLVAHQLLKASVYGPERFNFIDCVGQEVRLKLDRCAAIRAAGAAS